MHFDIKYYVIKDLMKLIAYNTFHVYKLIDNFTNLP